MLSSKMVFSLRSLITLFVFALVLPSVMAGDFKVTITGPGLEFPDSEFYNDDSIHNIELVVVSDQTLPTTFPGNINLYVEDNKGFPLETIDYKIEIADDENYPLRTPKVRRLNVKITGAPNPPVGKIILTIPAFDTPDPTVLDANGRSKAATHTILLVNLSPSSDHPDHPDHPDHLSIPKVVSIQRLRPISQAAVSAFEEQRVMGAFDVRIVLTEKPHDGLKLDLIQVEGGIASDLKVGTPFTWHGGLESDGTPNAAQALRPHPSEGRYQFDPDYIPLRNTVTENNTNDIYVPLPTSDNGMYHQYRVTITPYQRATTVKISIKEFHDGETPYKNYYLPIHVDLKPNGREQLRLNVEKVDPVKRQAGYRVVLPKGIVIPAGGYLVITKNTAGSEVVEPEGSPGIPDATVRTRAERLYNVVEAATLPNLAIQLLNGVVVDVESQHTLIITEVMWGEDASLNPSTNSQWIELYNPGNAYTTVDDTVRTINVNEALTLSFYAPHEFTAIPVRAADGTLPAGITDRIGTIDATGQDWSPAGKGQSGRTGTGEQAFNRGAFVGTVELKSMYRVIDAIGVIANGQLKASWVASARPGVNFDLNAVGIRIGTPGAAADATETPADIAAEQKKIASTGTIPEDGQIYISEIMFAGGGTLPQWIEIANGSKTEEVNLSGWTLTVANAVADADVSVGATATFTIPDGTKISPSGQHDSPSTILVVTEQGRSNVTGEMAAGQVVNLWRHQQDALILLGVTKRKYSLLSDMAFQITLAPPEIETIAANQRNAATDRVGNLGADGTAAWVLPVHEEGGRSSILRRHVPAFFGPAEPKDGRRMDNWVLASDTNFAQPMHDIHESNFYGSPKDVGTPGFRAGGALPVELSHFRPARDKTTGTVVITWSTQSELNNAGFFIKRSNQPDGEFKVINAAMITGAGTTSEKQFYIYTDTTAQPNVVYYYQIEDVSLDGNRQVLTRGIRLKGHVGAAGKATLTWGELKSSRE